MKKIAVKNLKKGELFKVKDNSSIVWVRGEYVREVKKYSTYKFSDVNHEKLLKGNQLVFIGFTF